MSDKIWYRQLRVTAVNERIKLLHMKKILVPTDFSKFADFAAELATSLAKTMEAEVHFVHLMDIPIDWIKLIEADQKKMYPDITSKVKAANSKLDALVQRVEKAGLKAKCLIQYNSDYKFIAQYTKTFQCDFIVMGSHGASGFTEWFVGSNTQKVVRRSDVPVIVVKNDLKPYKFDELVFVSEFDREHVKPFKWMLDFAKILGAKVHLLFINIPANFTETQILDKKMKPFIAEGGELILKSTVYNCYDFEKGLSEIVIRENQLVAMATHGDKNSLTEKVINHLDTPVLSIKM